MASGVSATLARLCCWLRPDRLASFESAYEQRLMPVLKRHGLVGAAECGRPTVAGVFNRLFAVEHPTELEAKRLATSRDPAWAAALGELGQRFGSREPDGRLRCSLELYQAPVGPGRTVEVGPGVRRGLWQRFEFQDGLPTYVVTGLRQERQGGLWLTVYSHGLCQYDGAQVTTFGSELAGFFAARMAGHPHKRITRFAEDVLAALQAAERNRFFCGAAPRGATRGPLIHRSRYGALWAPWGNPPTAGRRTPSLAWWTRRSAIRGCLLICSIR